MISSCPLRCHHLDRRDELEGLKFNRQLNGGPAKKREELEAAIKNAQEKLEAFDKSQVNLSKDFFGTWTVYSAKTQCTETYQFTQPGQFVYTTKQKRMTGEFAVVRNQDAKILDWLAMDVKTDNKKADFCKLI